MNIPAPVAPIRALAASNYADPTVFAAKVSAVGEYLSFDIAGQSLFCIRGRDQILRCFYNACQHRAHQLVSGSGNTRVVVCPYHAWTYELTGGLRAGPNIRAVKNFNRADICLTEVRCEDFHGFIFVNLDQDAAPMDAWYPEVRAELAAFVPDIAALAPLEFVDVPENCNWKVSVENYSECYHCPTNHATFATGVIKPETYDIRASDSGYVLRHTTECQSLDKMTYPVDLSANAHAGDYQSWFLWPMFSFQCYPGNLLNTYHWRADDFETCTVHRGWYTKGGAENAVVRKLARQDRDTTVAEDITLVDAVQRGLKSKGYVPGPLVVDPKFGVNSEHSIVRLQHWMREAIDG